MLVVFHMEVILADTLGFCYGVKRAVEMVEQVLREGVTQSDVLHFPV